MSNELFWFLTGMIHGVVGFTVGFFCGRTPREKRLLWRKGRTYMEMIVWHDASLKPAPEEKWLLWKADGMAVWRGECSTQPWKGDVSAPLPGKVWWAEFPKGPMT